jgi:hypothetical protein
MAVRTLSAPATWRSPLSFSTTVLRLWYAAFLAARQEHANQRIKVFLERTGSKLTGEVERHALGNSRKTAN